MTREDFDGAALEWMGTPEGEAGLKADIEQKWSAFGDASANGDAMADDALRRKSYRALEKRLFRRRVRLARRAAAAVVLLLLGAGAWLWLRGDRAEPVRIARYSDQVRLTLPDGSEIVLGPSAENGLIADQGGVAIVRENGRLVCRSADADMPAELLWSAVEVPRGERFGMTLEDGTQVWLNAGSRLRFPVAFVGDRRCVELEGEACFEVAGDAGKPFVVTTPAQSVTVLGTLFNVYAYRDEEAEYTTLAEGSVSLSSGGGEPVIIEPGQQAVLAKGSTRFVVAGADTNAIFAWRDGVFSLDGNTFEEVFSKLSRWYDFSYSFENAELSRLTFSGNLRQYESARQVFDVIETIARVKIEARGGEVRIRR
jgi:ferric-dicitrate binding protein FerR (iron transport regulator)